MLKQIIMHNCFSDEFKLKLGYCANLADMFNKLRRLVLSPEHLAKSFSEVIERWKKVIHFPTIYFDFYILVHITRL